MQIQHKILINSALILLFMIPSACGSDASENDRNSDANPAENTSEPITIGPYREFEPNSGDSDTDYRFDFKQGLPSEFHFDTIIIKKTDIGADYSAYYLQSTDPDMKDFNQKMLNSIVLNIESDAEHINGPKNDLIDPYYTYELGPFEFYMSDDIISMCYVIDTYTHGGNHHNYSWYTFNYDRKTKNVLRLEDVFILETVEDSVALLADIRKNLAGGNSCDELFEPFEQMDFSFVRDGIVMNPYLSWACGMQRALLKSDMQFATIKKGWR